IRDITKLPELRKVFLGLIFDKGHKSLTAKGKKSQVAITAVARELTGFMWDIALAAQSSFSQQKQN
ncbi:hypothetical protein ABHB52_09960, partial [Escherichia coli]|nr:hypothetical protein [Escherichia coli]